MLLYTDKSCKDNRPLPPITIEDLNEKTVFDGRKYFNEELKGMFFNLDLIQSYGSGIRRAKKAMEDKGFPRFVFSPDNDTDAEKGVMELSKELQQVIDNEKAEAQRETQRDMARLMKYLLANGRNEDALKATTDESFLNKLLAEFRGGMMVAK